MTPRPLLSLALFNLALGFGIISWFLLKPLTCEVYAYWSNATLPSIRTEEHLSINAANHIIITERYAKQQAPSIPLISLHKDAISNIPLQSPMSIMDWTVLLYQLHIQQAKGILVIAPLTWDPPPDDIMQNTIGYEINAFAVHAIGRTLLDSARSEPIPPALQTHLIPLKQIDVSQSKLASATRPQGTAPEVATTAPHAPVNIETAPAFMLADKEARSIPLLIRWGDQLLPTLPLIAVLQVLQVPIAELYGHVPGMLHLGNKAAVKVDEEARTSVANAPEPTFIEPEHIIPLPNEVPLPTSQDSATANTIKNSPFVILAEPADANHNAPTPLSIQVAKSTSALLAGIIKQPDVSISPAPAGIQWLIIFNIIILGIFFLRFSGKIRWIGLSATFLTPLILAWLIYVNNQYWLPFPSALIAIILLMLVGIWYPPIPTPAAKTAKPFTPISVPDDDDDSPGDIPFEQPAPIPIPIKATTNSSSTP